MIFLIPLFSWVQIAWSGSGVGLKTALEMKNDGYSLGRTPFTAVDLNWNRSLDGHAYAEDSYPGTIKTAQFLKEISEQEHRIAQFINAARVGDIEKVRKFLDQGMDINAKNKSGNTALMEACASGQEDVINLLLDRQADPAIKNNIKETATSKAIRSRQYRVITILGDRKAIQSEGIIIESIVHGDADFVESVMRGLDEAFRKKLLAELLHVACLSGKVEVVKLFLDKGADPNQNKGRPLSFCSGSAGAPVEAVRLLLERGADANLYEKTPTLIQASDSDRPDVVTLLLEKGAKINARGENGQTALMAALTSGASQDKIVKILLEKGADVHLTNKSGQTALAVACQKGRVGAARLFLDKGANVNVKAEKGVRPLHEAAFCGSVEMVELLLSRGADLNARMDNGGTALVIASRKGHKKVEAALRKHGAKQ